MTQEELKLSDINENFLNHYCDLKNRIKKCESEIDEMKDEVFVIVDSHGTTVSTDCGDFYINKKNTFKYSDAVVDLEKKLKAMKKEEEENKMAQIVNTVSFVAVKLK